jgi:hypothetical protein
LDYLIAPVILKFKQLNIMIDNIELIKKLLVFDSEDDFYHLQIIKRKKEHPELGSNSTTVKTYYIRSLDYLDLKYEEIKTLCNHHNARGCINLNRRSFEKIAFHTLRKVTDQIMNKDFKSVTKAYESCCGTYSNEPNKKWIIDIDDKNFNCVPIIDFINSIQPIGDKYKATILTKNGYHLIVSPFDLSQCSRSPLDSLDIHKDNPTILYTP